MAARNLATTLRRRPQGGAMADFDALPPVLRAWAARAALPWSPRSVRAAWRRALAAAAGDTAAALARLDAAEARALARDCRRVWGPAHPAAVAAVPRPAAAGQPRQGARPPQAGCLTKRR